MFRCCLIWNVQVLFAVKCSGSVCCKTFTSFLLWDVQVLFALRCSGIACYVRCSGATCCKMFRCCLLWYEWSLYKDVQLGNILPHMPVSGEIIIIICCCFSYSSSNSSSSFQFHTPSPLTNTSFIFSMRISIMTPSCPCLPFSQRQDLSSSISVENEGLLDVPRNLLTV